jgi:hypothetical protein
MYDVLWWPSQQSNVLIVHSVLLPQVMILMFLWPICNGVLEACERIEASAQQVLKPVPATHHSSSSGSKDTAAAHQHHSSSSKAGEHHGACARAQAAVVAWWHSLLRFVHWAGPLLLLVLMQGGWLAGYRAVATSVPATLSSMQREFRGPVVNPIVHVWLRESSTNCRMLSHLQAAC